MTERELGQVVRLISLVNDVTVRLELTASDYYLLWNQP